MAVLAIVWRLASSRREQGPLATSRRATRLVTCRESERRRPTRRRSRRACIVAGKPAIATSPRCDLLWSRSKTSLCATARRRRPCERVDDRGRPPDRPADGGRGLSRDDGQGLYHAAARDAAHGAQDPQPLALLRLPDTGLLLLAPGRGARAQGGAHRHDRARAHPPHLLRLCPGRAGGHAQSHHPPAGRPADRFVPALGLSGTGRRCALRPVRPAAVRLVPLPDPRGVRQGRRELACAQAGAAGDHRAGRCRQGAAWDGDPGACQPALEVAARQGPAPVHAGRPARPEGGAAALPTSPRSAISSASPRAWGWAWR